MKRKGLVGGLFGRIEANSFAWIKKTKYDNLIYKSIRYFGREVATKNLKKITSRSIYELPDFQDTNLIIINNYLKTMNVE